MFVVKIRLGEADLTDFGCPPELRLDLEAVKDLAADELEAIDQALELPLTAFISMLEQLPTGHDPAQVRRVAVWLALRQSGHEVDWEKCKPRLLRASFEREVPPGPPAGPSESSSEDAASVNS